MIKHYLSHDERYINLLFNSTETINADKKAFVLDIITQTTNCSLTHIHVTRYKPQYLLSFIYVNILNSGFLLRFPSQIWTIGYVSQTMLDYIACLIRFSAGRRLVQKKIQYFTKHCRMTCLLYIHDQREEDDAEDMKTEKKKKIKKKKNR